jgi:hypothetical protein
LIQFPKDDAHTSVPGSPSDRERNEWHEKRAENTSPGNSKPGSASSTGGRKSKNPFSIPTEEELLQSQLDKRETKSRSSQKVSDKTTAAFRYSTTRLKFGDLEINEEVPPNFDQTSLCIISNFLFHFSYVQNKRKRKPQRNDSKK